MIPKKPKTYPDLDEKDKVFINQQKIREHAHEKEKWELHVAVDEH